MTFRTCGILLEGSKKRGYRVLKAATQAQGYDVIATVSLT